MKITISIPHGYNSEADMCRAMKDCGGGVDRIMSVSRRLHDRLHSPAIEAGLEMIEPTDFGITYEGTKDQIDQCRSKLPSWAYVHVDTGKLAAQSGQNG